MHYRAGLVVRLSSLVLLYLDGKLVYGMVVYGTGSRGRGGGMDFAFLDSYVEISVLYIGLDL